MTEHRIYKTSFASVYPHYVAKAQKKGRTKAEVDEIIGWLTGFSPEEFERQLAQKSDFQTFFDEAPAQHPARADIKGVVCGVRVENIAEPLMREIRYLDKLIDRASQIQEHPMANAAPRSSSRSTTAIGCRRLRPRRLWMSTIAPLRPTWATPVPARNPQWRWPSRPASIRYRRWRRTSN